MSMITMMIGFWDLYKNVPILSDLIHMYLNSVYEFFEAHVSIRMSMLLGLLISKSTPFLEMINYILQPGVFSVIVTVLNPIFSLFMLLVREVGVYLMFLGSFIQIPVFLVREIITPVVQFVIEIVKIKWSLVKLILYLPSISIVKLCLMVKEAVMGVLLIFKSIFSGFSLLKRLIIPAAQSTYEHKETTMSFI